MAAKSAEPAPVLVLGAGYAGVSLCHAVRKAGRGRIGLEVVDRHPSHTLRTRLYEVGRIAEAQGRADRWSVPIDQVLAHDRARFRAGEVETIDLEAREVRVGGERLAFASLAICLGSVAAYYGIPGAAEHTEQVYRFDGAMRLSARLREMASSVAGPAAAPPKVVVVGGGSTGTELAAEIATTDWGKLVGRPVPRFRVTLVVGSVPFLQGLPTPLIRHAERLLDRAGVERLPGRNVRRVEPGRLSLEDGSVLEADAIVWCAGLEAPPVVKAVAAAHGKGGRLLVDEHLQVPGHPGVFAVGDVAELKDPRTGLLVPGTAQAALAEAPIAGRNLVAHLTGRPGVPFVYRERGLVVEVGRRAGAGNLGALTVWGRPAALLKALVDGEYRAAVRRGRSPPGL